MFLKHSLYSNVTEAETYFASGNNASHKIMTKLGNIKLEKLVPAKNVSENMFPHFARALHVHCTLV